MKEKIKNIKAKRMNYVCFMLCIFRLIDVDLIIL